MKIYASRFSLASFLSGIVSSHAVAGFTTSEAVSFGSHAIAPFAFKPTNPRGMSLGIPSTSSAAAHFFGDHPYDNQSWPAENPFVSLAAIGEGWHNWHHKYPYDYAASEFGVASQFNPTKLFIDGCAALGLVTNRKRATGAWNRVKAQKGTPKEHQQNQLLIYFLLFHYYLPNQ